MAGVGCRGTWGTRGARLSRVVLLQDVCSNTWLRSWASLLKDQSRYCPCAALVVQNSLFFLLFFFFFIGNCQMLQEGENPACVRAMELLPRTPWAQQEQLVVLSAAAPPGQPCHDPTALAVVCHRATGTGARGPSGALQG